MRASIITMTPQDWLLSLGKSPREIADILASFAPGAPLRLCLYSKEHTFLRFHGKYSRTPIFGPNYWADGLALGASFGRANQFEGLLTKDEIARIAKNNYRELTAICHNWNELRDQELWKIDLRDSETVEGLEGPVAPQPAFAATASAPASTSRLRGGGTQVYLYPRSPFICTPLDWNRI